MKKGRGEHRKYLPLAFTEQGVAMPSSVLRSLRAVQVNIEIMRAFVRLRRMLESNAGLSRKLDALERKYDGQFRAVFEAIRELMTPTPKLCEAGWFSRSGVGRSVSRWLIDRVSEPCCQIGQESLCRADS